jgi:hypothetical protein
LAQPEARLETRLETERQNSKFKEEFLYGEKIIAVAAVLLVRGYGA